LRVAVGEVSADIAVSDSTQQGIAQRMDQHVSIRMPEQPARMRNLDPTNNQTTPLGQPMRVVSYSRPNHGRILYPIWTWPTTLQYSIPDSTINSSSPVNR